MKLRSGKKIRTLKLNKILLVLIKKKECNDKCRCECKKRHVYEEDYIWNPSACSCENGKYLASIMDDSVIQRRNKNYSNKF